MPGSRRARRPVRKPRKAPQDLSLPPSSVAWVVDEADAGKRLDRFLIERFPWRSRTTITRFIEEGRVRVGGEPARRKAQRLARGASVVVDVPPPRDEVRHAELAASLDVLHEDEDLIAIAKPAGLVVHPVGKTRVNTLIQALHWRFRRGASPGAPDVVPKICHRLDKDTSGVLVIAKDDRARMRIQEIFERREIEKEYVAVVAGVARDDEGTIDRPIGLNPRGKVRMEMCVREDGAPSRTRFSVLERFADATLVRFDLETGRQHQIRVHAASIGHPVLLDPIYGPWSPGARWPEEGEPLLARHALHARRLALPHPRTGARLELSAPIPVDMAAVIERFRSGSPRGMANPAS